MNRKFVQLRASNGLLTSDSPSASSELDLGPYVNAGGKRQIIAVWAPGIFNAATDTDATYDEKLQQSATTVDTDFTDITGGAFTQVSGDLGSMAFQSITVNVTQRYIRSVATLAGTVPKINDMVGLILTSRFP